MKTIIAALVIVFTALTGTVFAAPPAPKRVSVYERVVFYQCEPARANGAIWCELRASDSDRKVWSMFTKHGRDLVSVLVTPDCVATLTLSPTTYKFEPTKGCQESVSYIYTAISDGRNISWN